MKWLRTLLALWLWAAMAPFLLIGWLVGIAWIGLAAGFRLGGLAVIVSSPDPPDPDHRREGGND